MKCQLSKFYLKNNKHIVSVTLSSRNSRKVIEIYLDHARSSTVFYIELITGIYIFPFTDSTPSFLDLVNGWFMIIERRAKVSSSIDYM